MTEEIPSIPFLLGKLQASVDGVGQGQIAHQTRDDARHTETQDLIVNLTKHVNHENDLMDQRIVKLEHSETQRRANFKTASWAISVAGATIGLIVLFLSGTWDHWFGR